ncbi:MAG TPA: hypothetical protein VIJ79_05865 [Acidobacteriaceae bacterium]
MSQMDEFGRHEVRHMSYFLAGAVEEQLLDHEQVKSRPEWLALATKACEALNTLYQATAQEDNKGHDKGQ